MRIDRVTMTGPDDSIRPEDLVAIAKEFPFVEWGILLSRSQEGAGTRFPSREWMGRLKAVAEQHDLALAGHLCGGWVRDLACNGKFSWLDERPELPGMFRRLQLNFHAERHDVTEGIWNELAKLPETQFIFQMDERNNYLFHVALAKGINAVPLFDVSHGAGVVPSAWPNPIDSVYCGYAGGLGPDTLREQLQKIADTVGDRTIWIDMETRIRSNADQQFDSGEGRCLPGDRQAVGQRG